MFAHVAAGLIPCGKRGHSMISHPRNGVPGYDCRPVRAPVTAQRVPQINPELVKRMDELALRAPTPCARQSDGSDIKIRPRQLQVRQETTQIGEAHDLPELRHLECRG